MAETLKLSILSPERKLLENALVEWVTLPGSEGQIQILPGHAAMVGTLQTGVFTFQTPGQATKSGVITTGFFEIKADEVAVMAETIELAQEIDANRAKIAQQKAETALQSPELDEQSFKKYQLKVQRALIRQQVAARE